MQSFSFHLLSFPSLFSAVFHKDIQITVCKLHSYSFFGSYNRFGPYFLLISIAMMNAMIGLFAAVLFYLIGYRYLFPLF